MSLIYIYKIYPIQCGGNSVQLKSLGIRRYFENSAYELYN